MKPAPVIWLRTFREQKDLICAPYNIGYKYCDIADVNSAFSQWGDCGPLWMFLNFTWNKRFEIDAVGPRVMEINNLTWGDNRLTLVNSISQFVSYAATLGAAQGTESNQEDSI